MEGKEGEKQARRTANQGSIGSLLVGQATSGLESSPSRRLTFLTLETSSLTRSRAMIVLHERPSRSHSHPQEATRPIKEHLIGRTERSLGGSPSRAQAHQRGPVDKLTLLLGHLSKLAIE